MKKTISLLLAAVIFSAMFLLVGVGSSSAEQDAAGAQDHPLLSRLPGFYISEYKDQDFAAFDFNVDKKPAAHVEGHKYFIGYRLNAGEKPRTGLQVMRNAQNALKKVGGAVMYEYEFGGNTVVKLVKGGTETWVKVDAGNANYDVLIIEKAAMEQEMVANADALGSGLAATGHAVVDGILFDTGKADLKPASEAALAEVAKLLTAKADLKVRIVGHTDNVGTLDGNLKLSQARAESVVAWLTSKGKIAAARLSAHGVASLAPVASNRAEEGRKQNRRVEIIEQ